MSIGAERARSPSTPIESKTPAPVMPMSTLPEATAWTTCASLSGAKPPTLLMTSIRIWPADNADTRSMKSAAARFWLSRSRLVFASRNTTGSPIAPALLGTPGAMQPQIHATRARPSHDIRQQACNAIAPAA